MSTEQKEFEEFFATVKANMRPHAGYFSWCSDRTVEEVGVVHCLQESLADRGETFFHSVRSRGEANDPPDCEALSDERERIAFEVTELVDGESIAAAQRNRPLRWGTWTEAEVYTTIQTRIRKKDNPHEIKGGPYSQYVLVIYCDEPRVLDYALIKHVGARKFGPVKLVDRIFLLMSYNPWQKTCPFVELKLSSV